MSVELNSTVQTILQALEGHDDRTKSDQLGHIASLTPDVKEVLVTAVFDTLDTGPLGSNWNSYDAGGYGVALALTGHCCVDALVAYGTTHAADTERRAWVHRIFGEIRRRNEQAEIPAPQAARAVEFLSEAVSSSSPSDVVAWSAAESLGEWRALGKPALPVLENAIKADEGLDLRVAKIYRTAIDRINGA